MQQPFNDIQDDVLSHQHELERDNNGSEGSSINIISDFHQSEEYAEIGDTSFCDWYINDLHDVNQSIDDFDIVSNASADLWCQDNLQIKGSYSYHEKQDFQESSNLQLEHQEGPLSP